MGIPYSQKQFMAEVQSGNTEAVELFLRAGASPEGGLGSLSEGPLHIAVKKGDEKMVKTLLAHGANPNRRRWITNETPLMAAVKKDQAAIVKLLLDHGAFVNAKDDKGKTVLALAQSKYGGNTAIAQLLKEAGAK